MTTLTAPSFDGRLLKSMKEEVEATSVRDWSPESVELCLDLLRTLHGRVLRLRQTLEETLSEGVEARSFAVSCGPFLPIAHECVAAIEVLTDQWSQAEDNTSKSLMAVLRPLRQEYKAFQDLLTEAVSLAAKPSHPVDWERIRLAEEADARGETKPFYRR
jgi:hypothetical protein